MPAIHQNLPIASCHVQPKNGAPQTGQSISEGEGQIAHLTGTLRLLKFEHVQTPRLSQPTREQLTQLMQQTFPQLAEQVEKGAVDFEKQLRPILEDLCAFLTGDGPSRNKLTLAEFFRLARAPQNSPLAQRLHLHSS